MADFGQKSRSLIPRASAPHLLVVIAMLTSIRWLITFRPLYYQTAEFGVDTAKMGNLEIVALPLRACRNDHAKYSKAAETLLV